MRSEDYYGNTLARTLDWKEVDFSDFRESGLDFMMRLVTCLPVNGGRFLDIGCQAGHLINGVKTHFNESIGVDIGDYSEYWEKIEGASFLVHDIDSEKLPFPSEYFDVVTCFMVLEHVYASIALTLRKT